MEASKAREILQALLDGVDPESGELLPDDSVFCEPNVIRALHHAIFAMSERAGMDDDVLKNGIQNNKPKPENAGKPWNKEEDEQVLEMYKSGVSISVIARQLGRSHTSIRCRLVSVGMYASQFDVPERYIPAKTEREG